MAGFDARTELPDRIWIVGPCGSGKSTLARRLAALLGIEATHMDEIHHQPGWTEAPTEQTARRVAEVVARPRWVIDGNYRQHRRASAHRTQLYVWLDLPLHVTFPRLVRRGVARSLTREPCCNGNLETLRRTFLHRESLLLWALTGSLRQRGPLGRELAGRAHVRFRSSRAADRWFAALLDAEAGAARAHPQPR